jgi:hypothetical protein
VTRYLYAFVGRDAAVGIGRARVRGVRREPLEIVRAGSVHAVVGDAEAQMWPDLSNLRRYDEVIRRLWERHAAALPARFGTIAPDQDDLVGLLRDREREFRARLTMVRHRGQMTARAVLDEEPPGRTPVRARTGAEYLLARAAQLRHVVEPPGFDAVRRAVARWVASERLETRGRVTSAYHLVPRSAVGPYRREFERAARSAGLSIVLTGPLPPYAFAADLDEFPEVPGSG